MRVVQDQIFEVDQLAFQPERRCRIVKMHPLDPALADRRTAKSFVESANTSVARVMGRLSRRQSIFVTS